MTRKNSLPRKILVIRLKQIGDALLSLPVCNSLRASYPEAQIDYLVYQHITPLLEDQPAIDNIRVITPQERKNKCLYAQKVWSLRQQNYDLIIDLINVPISAITTFVCGAPQTIGFDKKRLRSRLYTTAVPHRDYGDTVTKKLDILQGLKDATVIDRSWHIPVSDADRRLVRDIMQKQGVDFGRPIIFVAASSRREDKLWPKEYMLETLNHLNKKYSAQLVFNWVPGQEGDYVIKLAKQLDTQQDVFPNIDLTLKQLSVALSMCDFFFGNDGGPHHMAIGTNVPSLAVYPPFHYKEAWLPLNDPRHQGVDIKDALQIDYEHFDSIKKQIKAESADYYTKIKADLVILKLDEMLESSLKQSE